MGGLREARKPSQSRGRGVGEGFRDGINVPRNSEEASVALGRTFRRGGRGKEVFGPVIEPPPPASPSFPTGRGLVAALCLPRALQAVGRPGGAAAELPPPARRRDGVARGNVRGARMGAPAGPGALRGQAAGDRCLRCCPAGGGGAAVLRILRPRAGGTAQVGSTAREPGVHHGGEEGEGRGERGGRDGERESCRGQKGRDRGTRRETVCGRFGAAGGQARGRKKARR